MLQLAVSLLRVLCLVQVRMLEGDSAEPTAAAPEPAPTHTTAAAAADVSDARQARLDQLAAERKENRAKQKLQGGGGGKLKPTLRPGGGRT